MNECPVGRPTNRGLVPDRTPLRMASGLSATSIALIGGLMSRPLKAPKMPCMEEVNPGEATKLLLIGNSGTGKTGAIASLAKAGYKLRILDFDAGLDIIANVLREDRAALKRVVYETCTDKLAATGGKVLPVGVPTAFASAMGLLTHWKVKETKGKDGVIHPAYDLGQVSSWGTDTILVIDSLTHLSNAAMRYVLAINGKSGEQPSQPNWGQAMSMVEDMLGLLYSSQIGCHVIITSHITFEGGVTDDKGVTSGQIGYPNTLGRKLPPKVGAYFNNIILAKSIGAGTSQKRQLLTKSEIDGTGTIELKVSDPLRVPHKLPLETGLADFFKILHGDLKTKA